MENFKIFAKENLGSVRVAYKEGKPWFIAKDVCECLLVKNSRQALSRLDADEKDVILNDTPGGKQEMSVVNESGLYALIMSSRKKEAREFQKWVTKEVLPSIRKNGGYVVGQENLNEEEMKKLKAHLDVLRLDLEGLNDYASTWEEMYFRLLAEYGRLLRPSASEEELPDEEKSKEYVRTPEGYVLSKKLWDEFNN